MDKEKIANRQLFYILFIVRTNIVIAFLPVLTTGNALQDAWASAIVQFFPAALLVMLIGGLGIRFPELTVVQYGRQLLGKWAGTLTSLVILWVFLHFAAADVRMYGEVLITGFLTETPLAFIIGMMVLVSAIAAYGGIEVIGRCADLLFPLYFLMILAGLLFPIPQMEELLFNLEPVLARGALPVLGGAITPFAVIAQFLVLTILIPHCNEPKRSLRTALWALGGATLVLVFAALVTTVLLSPHRAARSLFPFFTMIRALQISEFLERVEVLAIFAWGFGLFIGLSVFLYCGARGMAQVLGLKNHRPLVGPMAVIWIVLGIHAFKDVFQLRVFFQPLFFGPYAAGLVVIPMGLLWAGYLVRLMRGGGSGAP